MAKGSTWKQLPEQKQRLVLVPSPYQGHISPMLQLAGALHSHGFAITIAHTVFNAPTDRPHHFSFVALPEGLSDRAVAAKDPVTTTLIINENCRESFRAALLDLAKVSPCIVISDEFMFFAEDVAGELEIPSVILRTTSAATSLARSGLVKLIEQGHILEHDPLSHEIVPELAPLRFKDLPFSLTHEAGKYSLLMTRIYGERKSSATLWNTVNCLEQPILEQIRTQLRAPLFPIGPLYMIAPPISGSLIEEDRSCMAWLDEQECNSVIYLSCLGSLAMLTEAETDEIACGLAESGLPFLWVIRPDAVIGSGWSVEPLLRSVGSRGRVVQWAPQKEVLAHSAVGGFWSHCGWNSTLESLSEGVPMICRPCFSDQRVNARYACHVWRIGLELEGLERGSIRGAVRRLILGEEGREMRARAEKFKAEIGASARDSGSSSDAFDGFVKFISSQN